MLVDPGLLIWLVVCRSAFFCFSFCGHFLGAHHEGPHWGVRYVATFFCWLSISFHAFAMHKREAYRLHSMMLRCYIFFPMWCPTVDGGVVWGQGLSQTQIYFMMTFIACWKAKYFFGAICSLFWVSFKYKYDWWTELKSGNVRLKRRAMNSWIFNKKYICSQNIYYSHIFYTKNCILIDSKTNRTSCV